MATSTIDDDDDHYGSRHHYSLISSSAEEIESFFNLVNSGATLPELLKVFGKNGFKQLLLTLLASMTEAEIARKVGRSHKLIAFWTKRFGLFHHKSGFKGVPLLIGSLLGKECLPLIKTMQGRRVKIVSVSPDSDLAYFLGFAIGDGSLTHRTVSIHQSLGEKDYLPILESLLVRLSRKLGGGVNRSIHQERLLDLTWCNSRICRIIMFLHEVRYDQIDGFLNGRLSAEFVAGFWDADGDVNREHPRLHNTDLRLLQAVQSVLTERFGVQSYIRTSTPVSSKRIIHGIEIISTRPLYCLQVGRRSRKKWAQTVGRKLKNPRKFEAADTWR